MICCFCVSFMNFRLGNVCYLFPFYVSDLLVQEFRLWFIVYYVRLVFSFSIDRSRLFVYDFPLRVFRFYISDLGFFVYDFSFTIVCLVF